MSKQSVLNKIDTIQGKIQQLWSELGINGGINCQAASRELNALKKKIETNQIKVS